MPAFLVYMDDITIGGLSLAQVDGGLRFGVDALLIAAYVRPCGECVEFGAGSGAISLLLASRRRSGHVTAIEHQPAQYDVMTHNIAANGLTDYVTPVLGDIRQYRPVKHPDAVVTNPPFMRTDTGSRNDDDGKYAARHEVNGDIGDFCRSAAAILGTGGAFYCVWRPDRAADLICACKESGLSIKRMTFVHHDMEHPACLMLIEARRAAGAFRSDALVTKPLIMYCGGDMTPDMKHICDNGEFDGSYLRR